MMIKTIFGLTLALIAIPFSAFSHEDASAHGEARYIANEGVLVSHGVFKVMFDPLPLSGFGVYPEPSSEDVEQMMLGQGVFEGVDLILISHAHRDHFSADRIVEYMQAQQDVQVVLPQQAIEMIAEKFQDIEEWDEAFKTRLVALDMEADEQPRTITLGEITIDAVRIPHAGWPRPDRAGIQNMLYRVSFPNRESVIHMGDADVNARHFAPHKAYWVERATDLGLPPYWFLLSAEGRRILAEDVNIKKNTGVHVPIVVPQDLKESGQDFFSISGETRVLGK